MRVDQQQSVTMVVTTADGGALELDPGKSVVARVVSGPDGDGNAKISLAGQILAVRTDQKMAPGDTIRLTVQSISETQLKLVITPEAAAPPQATGTQSGSGDAATRARTVSGASAQTSGQPAELSPRTPSSSAAGAAAASDTAARMRPVGSASPSAASGAAAGAPLSSVPPGDGRGSSAPTGSRSAAGSGTAAGSGSAPGTPQVAGTTTSTTHGVRSAVASNPGAAAPTSDAVAIPNAGARPAQAIAPQVTRELAQAGVSVTADIVRAATRAIEMLTRGPDPATPDTRTAARVVAQLAARGLPTSEAVATRITAALDTAGRMGTQLQELARSNTQIAAAMPSGSPSAAALRGLLASNIPPAELAIARIAQAQTAVASAMAAAPGHQTITVPQSSASPQVIANMVASQLALASAMDDLTQGAIQPPPTTGSGMQIPDAAASEPPTQAAARQAIMQGTESQAQAAKPQAALPQTLPPTGASIPSPPRAPEAPPPLTPATVGPNSSEPRQSSAPGAPTQAQLAPQQRASSAEAATAPAGGSSQGTPPSVARVIAQLGIAVTRMVPAMINTAVAGDPALSATQQQIISRGEAAKSGFTPEAADGGGVGAPAPLVASLRGVLQSQTTTEALASQIGTYDADQLAHALQQLPQRDALRIAGRLLEMMPGTNTMPAETAREIRVLVHDILSQLGRELQPAPDDELGLLRQTLQHVAANDPRAHMARAAQQILDTADGQLILSQPRQGADPGYVWFTTPLPDNRQAEVLVRREPGRRTVSFDTFNVAFLLQTSSLGTLMINMEAHPGAVRTLVRTDRPEMEAVIAAEADALKEPLERAAGRPMVFNTGVLATGDTPPTLFEPQLGLVPGENAFYV